MKLFATDSVSALFIMQVKEVRYRVLGTGQWHHPFHRVRELLRSRLAHAWMRQVSQRSFPSQPPSEVDNISR